MSRSPYCDECGVNREITGYCECSSPVAPYPELRALRDLAKAVDFMLGCLPCRCHDAYKSRDLQDPSCPCDDLAPVKSALENVRCVTTKDPTR